MDETLEALWQTLLDVGPNSHGLDLNCYIVQKLAPLFLSSLTDAAMASINNLRKSAIQSKEIIFILRR